MRFTRHTQLLGQQFLLLLGLFGQDALLAVQDTLDGAAFTLRVQQTRGWVAIPILQLCFPAQSPRTLAIFSMTSH